MSGVMGLFHVIVTYATQQKNRGFNNKEIINVHGHIRNQQMIDEGKPDLVVAFKGGTGTADMVRRAKKHNIKVIEVKDG